MSDHNNRIKKAIETTKETIPGYFESTCEKHAELSEKPMGSVVLGVDAKSLEDKIASADWRPFIHKDVTEGCEAFVSDLKGLFGMIDLDTLPKDTEVTIVDPKKTGFASISVKGVRGQEVDFTVLILGKEAGKEVVFTFHPGEPCRPSTLPIKDRNGDVISIEEAKELGFEKANISSIK